VAVAVALVVVGYLLGTVPTALVVGRRLGHDPRLEGSGNPGASNVYRTMGRGPAAVVLAVDLVKGAVAAGLGWALGGHLVGVLAGAGAVVGHAYPLYRRGGKGVATAAGMLAVLYPLAAVASVVGWVAVAVVGRRPSLASLALAVGAPIGLAVTGVAGVELGTLAAVALLVVLRHGDNIRRLVHGVEGPIQAAQP
jgi:glycerol-3-phosphate acyltransferase PlsY